MVFAGRQYRIETIIQKFPSKKTELNKKRKCTYI